MEERLKSEIEFLERYLKREVRHVAFITVGLCFTTIVRYADVFIQNKDVGWSQTIAYVVFAFAIIIDYRIYKKQKLKLQETRINAIVESL